MINVRSPLPAGIVAPENENPNTGEKYFIDQDWVDSLEEIFENKEQIEVSRFYERLPKPHAMAIEEWLKDKIYSRQTDDSK